jgi:hypothetical protein
MLTPILSVAPAATDGFVVGLIVGVFVGLLAGPVVRSWLVWREWREASHEARLTEDLLERMESEAASPTTDRQPPVPPPRGEPSWRPSR